MYIYIKSEVFDRKNTYLLFTDYRKFKIHTSSFLPEIKRKPAHPVEGGPETMENENDRRPV